jgi:SAM-dependent methyltransferase
MPEQGTWVLDVGANLGHTTELLSRLGWYVVGLEVSTEVYGRMLNEVAPTLSGGAVIRAQLGDTDWERVPRFDAVLLFSVLHRVWALQGEPACAAVLSGLGARSDLLFVESATRLARFMPPERPTRVARVLQRLGAPVEPVPTFMDNDWQSSAQWHLEYFREVLPSHHAELLGRCNHTKKEPYRPVFMLSRK